MDLEELKRKLGTDKCQMNNNKNPIELEKFLSFLTVDTTLHKNNLGYSRGWRERSGSNNLVIKSGIYKGVEYLDNIEYGRNLHNPYNNYVNPFYLFDILTSQGKEFFLNYYKNNIDKIEKDLELKYRKSKDNYYSFKNTLKLLLEEK
jgi:hypothetical protein